MVFYRYRGCGWWKVGYICNKDIFYMQKLVCGQLGYAEKAAIPPDCTIE
jgi:hypothetical protein